MIITSVVTKTYYENASIFLGFDTIDISCLVTQVSTQKTKHKISIASKFKKISYAFAQKICLVLTYYREDI